MMSCEEGAVPGGFVHRSPGRETADFVPATLAEVRTMIYQFASKRREDDFMAMLSVRRSPEEEPTVGPSLSAEELRDHWMSLLDAKQYFKDYVSRLRREPGDDVFSALWH